MIYENSSPITISTKAVGIPNLLSSNIIDPPTLMTVTVKTLYAYLYLVFFVLAKTSVSIDDDVSGLLDGFKLISNPSAWQQEQEPDELFDGPARSNPQCSLQDILTWIWDLPPSISSIVG